MRHTGRSQLLSHVTIALALSFALLSSAVAAPSAEDLIQQGLELRRAGRDIDALAKFEGAYALKNSPRAAAQLGLCLQAVSRWSEAEPLLGEALTATEDPWIKKNRGSIKDSLESVKAHVGRVEVTGEPVGATVTLGGKAVGQFPLAGPLPVNEGVLDVEVSADGYEPTLRSITLPAASYQRLVIRLKKKEAKYADAMPVARVRQMEPSSGTQAVAASSSAGSEKRGSMFRSPLFWTGVGIVVAGVITTALLISSRTSYPEADERRRLQ